MAQDSHVPKRCEFELEKLIIRLDEVLPSDIRVVEGTVARITSLITRTGCWHDIENIDLSLREALANAILHGNAGDPKKSVRICVAVQEDCGMLIVVKDSGAGFDPNQLPNPVVGQNLLSGHGRGIFLINQLMEEVRFSFDSGTAIHMRRHGSAAHAAAARISTVA